MRKTNIQNDGYKLKGKLLSSVVCDHIMDLYSHFMFGESSTSFRNLNRENWGSEGNSFPQMRENRVIEGVPWQSHWLIKSDIAIFPLLIGQLIQTSHLPITRIFWIVKSASIAVIVTCYEKKKLNYCCDSILE